MSYLSFIGTFLLALALLLEPTAAQAKAKKETKPNFSAPREIVNPYQPALQCLASQLTAEQKATSIGVGYLLDRTGRDSYQEGKFLGQGGDDMMVTALAETGVKVVGFNPAFRQALDWQMAKLAANGQHAMITSAHILLEGSFGGMDVGPSEAQEFSIFGIGGGTRAYHLRYFMDIRVTSMPGGKIPGGEVLATLALEKDVIGRESKAGIASFFGGFGDPTYLEFNVKTQTRELLQYSQRYVISRAAFGIIANLWKITACNEILAYSDGLVSGQIQAAKNIPNSD